MVERTEVDRQTFRLRHAAPGGLPSLLSRLDLRGGAATTAGGGAPRRAKGRGHLQPAAGEPPAWPAGARRSP